MKLKNFSSGMAVRLGFSITSQVDADVLLFDEVLAVGDSSFQQKCFDRFQSVEGRGPHGPAGDAQHGAGRAVLRSGDAPGPWRDPCHRRAATIARQYNRVNFEHSAESPRRALGRRPQAVEIAAGLVREAAGEPVTALAQGEVCCACVEATARRPLEDPSSPSSSGTSAHRSSSRRAASGTTARPADTSRAAATRRPSPLRELAGSRAATRSPRLRGALGASLCDARRHRRR